jgi:hypothetical protein
MSEVYFFMTQDDTVSFCRFLIDSFECDFTMYSVTVPQFIVLTDPTKVAQARDPDGFEARFFVRSPSWLSRPLILQEIHQNDGRHRWYLKERYGGPAFDFSMSHIRSGEEGIQLIPGFFMDYPWYFTDTPEFERIIRPQGMQHMANSVRTYLRRHGVRTATTHSSQPGPWALEGALSAYRSGAWLRGGDWHYHPRTTTGANQAL